MAGIPPLKLKNSVLHYAWGREASQSVIAELADLDEETRPLAELWIGAHERAPSQTVFEGKVVGLDRLIQLRAGEILGETIFKRYGPTLPFLFKVLSISSALSIQAHPDKERAARLHAADPINYPDANHKPEVSVAISEVSLLYGFKPFEEIQYWLDDCPEFASLTGIDPANARQDDAALQLLFARLMTCSAEETAIAGRQLIARLKSKEVLRPEEAWFLKLSKLHSLSDPGLFCFFMMNLKTISAGQALYIAPNVLHAYLEGELVECMANSDNVVRAGLTSKFKDVKTLLEMCDFSACHPSVLSVLADANAPGRARYLAPVEEFFVERIEGSPNTLVTLGISDMVELLFCLNGRGQLRSGRDTMTMRKGDALLFAANSEPWELQFVEGTAFRVSVERGEF